MSGAGRWGERENLTLSDAELDRCEPIAAEGGRTLRAFCPFHGSDHQRSLRVNRDTGHFKCFACDAWGYLESARERHRQERGASAFMGSPGFMGSSPRPSPRPSPKRRIASHPTPEPEPRPELDAVMAGYRAALPGSPGEAYLRARGIPLAVAQRAGVGYAPPGTWAHVNDAGRPIRDWHRGRLVFPHTAPDGAIVNLYGRAVGDAPKEERHDHLPGAKGYFNAQALRAGAGPVTVCEGAFDALALMAAGAPRVVGIFGVNGWRWDWAKDVRELIFALDSDAAGAKGFHELAPVARLRGKRVAYLEPDAYGGEKDAAAAWAAGTLRLGDVAGAFAPRTPHDAPEAAQKPPTPAEPPRAPHDAPSERQTRPAPSEPMLWGAALLACERGLDVVDKLTAYELSHAYLEAGPEMLAALEDELREEVARLAAGDALPDLLAGMLFAWKNAMYMARHRRPDDLPASWRDAQATQSAMPTG